MNEKLHQNGSDVLGKDQQIALARYAAVCWVRERVAERGPHRCTLQTAIAMAEEKDWEGHHFSAGSIERYYYVLRHEDYTGLVPANREDKGKCKAFTPQQQKMLIDMRLAHREMDTTVLVDQLVDQGVLEAGKFSMSSVYRLYSANGVDRTSLRAGSFDAGSGPQKAFETPLPNMLWMSDMMYGPTLVTETGKVLRTRLFALIDDHSRLCTYGEYFTGEGAECFMKVLHEAVRARGLPDKIYTDNGKVFLASHLRVVCANLGIRLSRAKPYAAWSKGKVERFFRRVQGQFQQTLVFEPVNSLEDLNKRFWFWLAESYHQQTHRGTGESPASRFMAKGEVIRSAPPDEELRRLFLNKDTRRVRKDATVSVKGIRFELTPSLRGQIVEVRFDPVNLTEVEIWHQDHFVQIAKILDANSNANDYKPRGTHE